MGPQNFADALQVGHSSAAEQSKPRLLVAAAAADGGYSETPQAAVPYHSELNTAASPHDLAAQVRFSAASGYIGTFSVHERCPALA